MAVSFIGAPYLPSRRSDIKRALDELYPIGPDDTLVDIGSGDGVVLREAAGRGANAIGVEINPILGWLSKWLSRKHRGVSVIITDMWRFELPPEATVVYVFGTGRDVSRIAKWCQAQRPAGQKPYHLISYGFEMPWQKVRSVGAHHLYLVETLQSAKPQV